MAVSLQAHASTIQIDLGPPTVHKLPSPEVRIPFSSGITSFSGQHLTFDLTFGPGQDVILFPDSVHTSFDIMTYLTVSGNGTLAFPSFSAYTLGKNGLQNSTVFTESGGSVTTNGEETFNLSLGFVFPLDNQPHLTHPFGIYGFHIDFTLPTSTDFSIDSTNLFLGGGGSPVFVTGNIPETGNTALLFAFPLLFLALLRKKHCT